jgi:hypothetical protein
MARRENAVVRRHEESHCSHTSGPLGGSQGSRLDLSEGESINTNSDRHCFEGTRMCRCIQLFLARAECASPRGLLRTGITPIIFALRMALPSLLWLLIVNPVTFLLYILPISDKNGAKISGFRAWDNGSMPNWWKTSLYRATLGDGPTSGLRLRGGGTMRRAS